MSDAAIWWLRSPNTNNNNNVWNVNTDGSNNNNWYNNSYGVRPALVLVYKCGQEKSNNLYY